MIDPYSVLLESKDLLHKEGVIIASIPNVRYLSNVYNFLIRQDWQYEDCGILDRTHLRFFTKKSMAKTFIDLGYTIESIEGINSIFSVSTLKRRPKKNYLFNLYSCWQIWFYCKEFQIWSTSNLP
jgi:hypothetical protein